MRSSGGDRGAYNRIASGRLPIIVFGDSDAAQGYALIGDCDSSVQVYQPAIEIACRMYCHQGLGDPATWIVRDEIGPIGPLVGTGRLRGSWLLDLATALAARGVPATFLAYPVGSSSFDHYSPELNPTAYATRLNWVKARLAQMPAHQEPILLTDQGMAGQGTYPWVDAMTTLMAALRSDLGYPTMKVCQVRAPYTAGYDHFNELTDIIYYQNLYATRDSRCRLCWNDTTTYVDDFTLVSGQVHGVHFDAAGARKLAIGPDDATTKSAMTALLELIALP